MMVIDSYLDTLFAAYPDSPRIREAKAELRAMMEDHHQALLDDGTSPSQAMGQVIAEFGDLDEIAPELGISGELGIGAASDADDAEPLPRLDTARLEEYAARVRGTQWMTAVAVPLFVLCPVPLLGLIAGTAGADEEPAGWAVATGLITLLGVIALGVMLLAGRDARLADVQDIEDKRFARTRTVRVFAEELRAAHQRRGHVIQAVSVALWILCAAPVLILAFATDDGMVVLYGVCGTLAMVAIGLFLTTRTGWVDHVADTLLDHDEDPDDPENSRSTIVRVIAAMYWPVVFAVYLAWSFVGGAWDRSWVVFPVAGVLYAALWGLSSALSHAPAEHRARSPRVASGR